VRFYNERRLHQTLGYKTPAAVWAAEGSPVDLPLCLDDAVASPTTPQGQQQQNVTLLQGSACWGRVPGRIRGCPFPRSRDPLPCRSR